MSAKVLAGAPRAIVFAYHSVGVRCLRVLLDAGVDVPLVVTHADAPGENVWFDSVAAVAAEHRLRCVTPDDPHTPALLAEAAAAEPDFLFSFYYRQMLKREWLALPARGAFNMHGSLLPQYRGRAPVNWAVIHGERQTGATLHRMNEKPDNGAIVDQCAVPILGDDTAHDVFGKVVVAAEIVLARSLPRLLNGTAVETVQDLSQGAYFGGRRPQDGRIPADAGALQIHNLVRALAPPYPGAFLALNGRRVIIERTQRVGGGLAPSEIVESTPSNVMEGTPRAMTRSALPTPPAGLRLRLWSDGTTLWLVAADGSMLRVVAARSQADSMPLDALKFQHHFGATCVEADIETHA